MGRSIKFAAMVLGLLGVFNGRSRADSVLVNFEIPQATLGETTPFSVTSGGETIMFSGVGGAPAVPPAPTPFTVVSQGTNGDVVLGAAPGAGLSGQYLEGAAQTFVQLTMTFSQPVNALSFNYFASSPVLVTGGTVGANTITYSGPFISSYSVTILNPASTQNVIAVDNISASYVPEIDSSSATGALALLGSAVVMFRGRRKAVRA